MKIQAQYVWHESTLLIIIILSHKSRDIGKLFCVLNIKNWKSQVPSKDIYIDIYICVCICLHVCAQIKYVYSCICKWKLEVNVRCCLPTFPISFFSDRYSHWNWISPMWLSGWLSNFCGPLVSTSHWDYKYGCQQPALPHEHYEPEIRSPAICCDSPNIYMCTALNFFHVSWVWLFPHSQVTQMVIWRMETYLPWLCLSSLGSPSSRMVASCTFFLYCSFTSLLWQETWWSFLL